MTDPYTRKGIVKIATLLQEGKGNTQTSILLQSVAEGLRMKVGFSFTIGTLPYEWVKHYVTESWYTHLIQTINEHNKESRHIKVIDGYGDVKTLRHNNSFIMKGFQNVKVSRNHLQLLNTMRLALKVVTL